jgi:hypothetical protein
MERHFFIYGILSFLIFSKLCSILSVLASIIGLRLELNNIQIYFILVIFAILPIIFFIFYIKKIKLNFQSLVVLTFIYFLSYVLLYYLNTYLGNVLAVNFKNSQSNYIEVIGWSHVFTMLSEIILLLYLVMKTLKKVNSISQ